MTNRLVLWDIDGTLLRAGDIGAAVFDDAVEAVTGKRAAERVRMSGKTDPLIVREYLAAMGIAETDHVKEAILAALTAGLARAAKAGILEKQGSACPGAADALCALANQPDTVQSLLTGNLFANAVVKVSAFGLDKWLDMEVGAYGSDAEDRNALVPIALERFERLRGETLVPSQVWIIGDTPRDLACARAAGARCILVATGRYSLGELSGLGADAAWPDLTDTDALVGLISR